MDAGYPRCRRSSPKDFNSPIFLWTRRGLLIFCSGWHLFHGRDCRSSPRQRCFGASFTYNDEGGPGCRMGSAPASSNQHSHGTSQRLGATDGRVGAQSIPAAPEGMKDIEYFQIELATHEVILAEGAPVESYLNTHGREQFTNFVEYERLYGHEPGPTVPYGPEYAGCSGGRAHLKALLRLGIARIVDVRDPIQRAYDRIAARGTDLALSV